MPEIKIARPGLYIACILDEFSYECFKYEANLLPVTINNWEQEIRAKKPDLLLVESAWSGNNGQWMINNLAKDGENQLTSLVSFCNSLNIPTVFWNKEDPFSFETFISAAKIFDFIFTTDSQSVTRYKQKTGKEKVYQLSFAAQPRLHNPVDKDVLKTGRVAFAGSWYGWIPERVKEMEILLKPSISYGLHIYDRNQNCSDESCKYPDKYQRCIKGSLAYNEMVKTYKKYEVFLNANIVQNSPTMFSRRVFELLACGTNVISGYSIGIDNLFSDVILFSKNQKETQDNLEFLLRNKTERDRFSLLGQRKVFNEHTYNQRLDFILEKVGLADKKIKAPEVTVIAFLSSRKNTENLLANYHRQTYTHKEMIILDNEFAVDLSTSITSDYVAFFNGSDYYGPEYLTDLVNAFKYTDAGVIGKASHYVYLKNISTLVLAEPDKENRYVYGLDGATLLVKREVFEKLAFPNTIIEAETNLIRNCREQGFKIYATDRFNYVNIRSTELPVNSGVKESIAFCRFIALTKDYVTPTTV